MLWPSFLAPSVSQVTSPPYRCSPHIYGVSVSDFYPKVRDSELYVMTPQELGILVGISYPHVHNTYIKMVLP